jgi:hypothetical protein
MHAKPYAGHTVLQQNNRGHGITAPMSRIYRHRSRYPSASAASALDFQGIGGVWKTPPYIALPDQFDARYRQW